MCNPAIAMMAVTAGAQLYSGYQQNKAAQKQADATQATAAYNSRVQENQAIDTRNAGVEAENDQRRMMAELTSRQRAQLGASGTVIDNGSASLIQEDTQLVGEIDALRIRNNYQDRADAIQQGANLTQIEGNNAASAQRQSGKAALIGSVASAAGTVASRWYGPKSAAKQTGGNTSTSTLKPGDFQSNAYQRSLRVR